MSTGSPPILDKDQINSHLTKIQYFRCRKPEKTSVKIFSRVIIEITRHSYNQESIVGTMNKGFQLPQES